MIMSLAPVKADVFFSAVKLNCTGNRPLPVLARMIVVGCIIESTVFAETNKAIHCTRSIAKNV